MKKLLLFVPFLGLAACDYDAAEINRLLPDAYVKTDAGAGFSPYSKAEYEARLADRQPGIVPVNPYP